MRRRFMAKLMTFKLAGAIGWLTCGTKVTVFTGVSRFAFPSGRVRRRSV